MNVLFEYRHRYEIWKTMSVPPFVVQLNENKVLVCKFPNSVALSNLFKTGYNVTRDLKP